MQVAVRVVVYGVAKVVVCVVYGMAVEVMVEDTTVVAVLMEVENGGSSGVEEVVR